MASQSIMKQSTTLNITLIAVEGQHQQESVFKIDNPQSSLTLTDVRRHYANVIPGTLEGGKSLLFDRQGNPFKMVSSAMIVETTIIYTPLEEEEP